MPCPHNCAKEERGVIAIAWGREKHLAQDDNVQDCRGDIKGKKQEFGSSLGHRFEGFGKNGVGKYYEMK